MISYNQIYCELKLIYIDLLKVRVSYLKNKTLLENDYNYLSLMAGKIENILNGLEPLLKYQIVDIHKGTNGKFYITKKLLKDWITPKIEES